MLAIIHNSQHKNNLLNANALYPLSRNDASKLIVRLGPLWITSIHDTYKNNSYTLLSKVNVRYVVLAALLTVGGIVEAIDSRAMIPESNSEEMSKDIGRAISLMGDNT